MKHPNYKLLADSEARGFSFARNVEETQNNSDTSTKFAN